MWFLLQLIDHNIHESNEVTVCMLLVFVILLWNVSSHNTSTLTLLNFIGVYYLF